jgi:hypothetical protein
LLSVGLWTRWKGIAQPKATVLSVIRRPYPRNLLFNSLVGFAREGGQVTPDQHQALRRLAGVPRGVTKSLMQAHGFTHEVITGLVLTGLATVVPEIARIGESTIEVELVMITDAGRKAIGN